MFFECRCVGVLGADLGPALEILRGICTSFRTVTRREIVLKAPLQPSATATSTEIRLVKVTDKATQPYNPLKDPPPELWLVRHEGLVLRGTAAELPASIREVTEATSSGAGVVDFWMSLGARLEYEFERTGNMYTCVQDGVEIQVFVFDMKNPKDGKVLKIGFLVEAVAVADTKEKIVPVARALGAFAQRLIPHVELRRADPR